MNLCLIIWLLVTANQLIKSKDALKHQNTRCTFSRELRCYPSFERYCGPHRSQNLLTKRTPLLSSLQHRYLLVWLRFWTQQSAFSYFARKRASPIRRRGARWDDLDSAGNSTRGIDPQHNDGWEFSVALPIDSRVLAIVRNRKRGRRIRKKGILSIAADTQDLVLENAVKSDA